MNQFPILGFSPTMHKIFYPFDFLSISSQVLIKYYGDKLNKIAGFESARFLNYLWSVFVFGKL